MKAFKKLLLIFSLLIIGFKVQAKLRIIGADPLNGVLAFKNYYPSDINLNQFILSYNNIDTALGLLPIISGDTIVKSMSIVFINVKNLNYTHGYLALHDFRYIQKIGYSGGLMDYMQWGQPGHKYEQLADTTFYLKYDTIAMKNDTIRVWKIRSYISTAAPFSFFGNSIDRGVSFWQSYKLPQLGIKIVEVIPSLDIIKFKNIGGSNVDLTSLIICSGNNCIDSLKNTTLLKGSLNLPKNDTLVITGLSLPDTIGNVSLFFPINMKDTVNLIDFVQWGGYAQGYSYLAHLKNLSDSNSYIPSLPKDTLYYTGNFTRPQFNTNYWKAYHYIADTTHHDTTGIANILSSTYIDVYPNPSQKLVYIQNKSSQSYIYRLLNGNGSVVKEINGNKVITEMDIEELPNGMYLLQILSSNFAPATQKIIIKNNP